MTDKAKPQQDVQGAQQDTQQGTPDQGDVVHGENEVDTNAGPDAKEGTIANESGDPEEAK
jgi:hypothetical protein